ncbi:MAG: hypothetical protein ACRCSQ_09125 [Bacteroidales bacterium]
MITWLVGLIFIFRLVMPVFGAMGPCEATSLAGKTSCSQLHPDAIETEQHNACSSSFVYSGHDSCCCMYEALPESAQEPVLNTTTPDFKFTPAILSLLCAVICGSDLSLSTPLITSVPEIPVYTGRQILALQSVLVI